MTSCCCNSGSGTFQAQPLGASDGSAGWSSSAAAADADRDGDLDLFVSRYVEYDPEAPIFCGDPESGTRRYCDPSIFAGANDRFFENLGAGRFEEATKRAGLAGSDGRGLGVLFSDLDGDLYPEIYVANDLTPNALYRNRGDGTFEDVSLLSGAAVNREGKPEAGMGIALGDHNGDLAPDIMVTNFDVETNTYYQAEGDLSFIDLSAVSGFGTPSFNKLAFGIVTSDLDGDGKLDVYVANGHIFEVPNRTNTRYRQADQVYLGEGGGRFAEARCNQLTQRETVARGLAQADYDNDGDPDLALQENGGAATVLRNETPSRSWFGMGLRGLPGNTEGVGARVLLNDTESSQVRWVIAGDSYQSASERRLLFAPKIPGGQSSLEVRWPSGQRLRLEALPEGRYFVLAERSDSSHQIEILE